MRWWSYPCLECMTARCSAIKVNTPVNVSVCVSPKCVRGCVIAQKHMHTPEYIYVYIYILVYFTIQCGVTSTMQTFANVSVFMRACLCSYVCVICVSVCVCVLVCACVSPKRDQEIYCHSGGEVCILELQ